MLITSGLLCLLAVGVVGLVTFVRVRSLGWRLWSLLLILPPVIDVLNKLLAPGRYGDVPLR